VTLSDQATWLFRVWQGGDEREAEADHSSPPSVCIEKGKSSTLGGGMKSEKRVCGDRALAIIQEPLTRVSYSYLSTI